MLEMKGDDGKVNRNVYKHDLELCVQILYQRYKSLQEASNHQGYQITVTMVTHTTVVQRGQEDFHDEVWPETNEAKPHRDLNENYNTSHILKVRTHASISSTKLSCNKELYTGMLVKFSSYKFVETK